MFFYGDYTLISSYQRTHILYKLKLQGQRLLLILAAIFRVIVFPIWVKAERVANHARSRYDLIISADPHSRYLMIDIFEWIINIFQIICFALIQDLMQVLVTRINRNLNMIPNWGVGLLDLIRYSWAHNIRIDLNSLVYSF